MSPSAPRSLPWFFGLLAILSVPFLVIGALAGTIPGLPNGLPMSALMFVCPMLSAFILVRWREGPGSIARLMRRVFRGGRPAWMAVSVVVMPVLALLAYATLRVSGWTAPGGDIAWASTPVFAVVFFISALGEEIGWMGYAVDELQRKWSPLVAGLVLGLVWGVWHVVPLLQAGRTPGWMVGWFLSTVGARVIIVWLYNQAGGSVLAAIIVHDLVNVVSSLFPGYEAFEVMLALGGWIALGALVATVGWRRRMCRRPANADELSAVPRTA